MVSKMPTFLEKHQIWNILLLLNVGRIKDARTGGNSGQGLVILRLKLTHLRLFSDCASIITCSLPTILEFIVPQPACRPHLQDAIGLVNFFLLLKHSSPSSFCLLLSPVLPRPAELSGGDRKASRDTKQMTWMVGPCVIDEFFWICII